MEYLIQSWLADSDARQAANALRVLAGRPFTRVSFLVADGLRIAHPELTAAACRDALEWLRRERPDDTESLMLCVCALARTLHIPPPASVEDAAALDDFVARAAAGHAMLGTFTERDDDAVP